MNENHDPVTGQFTSGGAGGAGPLAGNTYQPPVRGQFMGHSKLARSGMSFMRSPLKPEGWSAKDQYKKDMALVAAAERARKK